MSVMRVTPFTVIGCDHGLIEVTILVAKVTVAQLRLHEHAILFQNEIFC
jgi:hypothetical protein